MTRQEIHNMDAEAQGVTPVECSNEAVTGLALLRLPFPDHQISKLPKPTKAQTDKVRSDFKQGIRCQLCGGRHHKDVVHLDYVGHAALTDRLLDADPNWNWEPVAIDEFGAPKRDQTGGMWIRLTVCGQTRLGYGDAEGKSGGNAVKELIGDALRNAAMRFGAALDLWHKGELHVTQDDAEVTEEPPKFDAAAAAERIAGKMKQAKSLDDLRERWVSEKETISRVKAMDENGYNAIARAKNDRKADLEAEVAPNADLDGDDIPYEGPSE